MVEVLSFIIYVVRPLVDVSTRLGLCVTSYLFSIFSVMKLKTYGVVAKAFVSVTLAI